MLNQIRKLLSRFTSSGDASQLPDQFEMQIENGITLVTFLHSADVEQTKQAIRYLGDNGIYHRRVWDMSRIDFPYTIDELKELAYFGRETLGGSNRVALVVKDSLGFGSSRAFATYRGGDDITNARVFKSLDEAMRWASEDT